MLKFAKNKRTGEYVEFKLTEAGQKCAYSLNFTSSLYPVTKTTKKIFLSLQIGVNTPITDTAVFSTKLPVMFRRDDQNIPLRKEYSDSSHVLKIFDTSNNLLATMNLKNMLEGLGNNLVSEIFDNNDNMIILLVSENVEKLLNLHQLTTADLKPKNDPICTGEQKNYLGTELYKCQLPEGHPGEHISIHDGIFQKFQNGGTMSFLSPVATLTYCDFCGAPIPTYNPELSVHCPICQFWFEILAEKEEHFFINGTSYCIGRGGFGGQKWNIFRTVDNSRFEQVELWCQGDVPKQFKKLLPNNAYFYRL